MPEASQSVLIATDDLSDELTLLDILDHVLNKGVVIRGNLVISLAGIDLVYVGLDVILTSVETALQHMNIASGAARQVLAPRPKAGE
jgi:gas vesicle protein GvpA/GvpJ/GvpM family